jgi:hypothetical protein
MIKGPALPEAVVETDLGNEIFPTVPEDLTGGNGVGMVVEGQDQRYRAAHFLDHKIVYPKKTRSQGIKWSKDAIFNIGKR